MIDLRTLDRHRQAKLELELYGQIGGSTEGCFAFKSPSDDKVLRVIAAVGDGWEHVSVSKVAKTPSWAEMEFVKRTFFKPDETAMQLHVPPEAHISFHAHCLHLWRPVDQEIPRPPGWMVGPKTTDLDDLDVVAMMQEPTS
jgi:hypothetical protein